MTHSTPAGATGPGSPDSPDAAGAGAPTGRTVLISGSGRGIGRLTAQTLLDRGWTVGVYDISDDVDWVDTLPAATRRRAHRGHLDVTDPESWTAALTGFTAATGGRLDALVNNAGLLYGGPFITEGSHERDAALVDVNVKGVLHGARAAYPYLRATPDARLVNLASASAIYGTPDMAVYSATKFAVRGITEALNLEWEEDGILVTDVWPLYVRTGMLDGVRTTGTDRLGVRLTPETVGRAVADVVEAPRRVPAAVHHPVGLQAKLLYAASHFSPAWLGRYVNAKLTTSRRVRI